MNHSELVYVTNQQRAVPLRRRVPTATGPPTPATSNAISVNVVVTIATLFFCVMLIVFIAGGLVLLNRSNDAMESVEALKTKIDGLAPRARLAQPLGIPSTKLLGSGNSNLPLLPEPPTPPESQQQHLVYPFTMASELPGATELVMTLSVSFEKDPVDLTQATVCCIGDAATRVACIAQGLVTITQLDSDDARKQRLELRIADSAYSKRNCWLLVLPQE